MPGVNRAKTGKANQEMVTGNFHLSEKWRLSMCQEKLMEWRQGKRVMFKLITLFLSKKN
jgi:hypothetical protein